MTDNLYESKITDGTYSALMVSEKNREEIFEFCVSQGIQNLVPSDDYHCTILYSRTPCNQISSEDFMLPCNALPVGYKILGTDEKVLVLELFCPVAAKLHKMFIEKHGATHDYPEYIPHITIAKDFDGEMPIELPDIMIEFDNNVVEKISD